MSKDELYKWTSKELGLRLAQDGKGAKIFNMKNYVNKYGIQKDKDLNAFAGTP